MSTPLVSYEIPTDREDLSDVVGILSERSTPFLDLIMNGGLAATNTRHEWVNTNLFGYRDQLNGAINSAVTTITVDGSYSGISNKYFIGTVILVDDERMQVTNVNSATSLDVTRGFDSTTAAAHSDNAFVEILYTPRPEAYIPTDSSHQFGAKDYNYSQIFSEFISMSGTSQALNTPGNENDMAVQTQRVVEKLMKDLERAAIRGLRGDNGSGDRRRMGGLEQFIPVANQTDGLNAPIDIDLLDDALLSLYANGSNPDILLVSQKQKIGLNNLKIARVNQAQPQSDKKINNLVDTYEAEGGPLRIIRSIDVAPDTLYIIDSGKMKLVPLQRRAFAIQNLDKVGDLDKKQVLGEYTMEMMNPEAHWKITNLAV